MNYRRARVGGWDVRLLGFALLNPRLSAKSARPSPASQFCMPESVSMSIIGPSSLSALPESGDRIRIEGRIAADDRDLFNHRLSDQQAVEWISMMVRQWDQGRRVPRFNVQIVEAVLVDGVPHEVLVGARQDILA
jgi:hypothetical protein